MIKPKQRRFMEAYRQPTGICMFSYYNEFNFEVQNKQNISCRVGPAGLEPAIF